MRLPFPERIPINRAAIFAVVLFAVQRIEGTPLYFCAGCLVFILIATLAFNTAGGLTRASGAYVFFYSLLVVIIGVCYKAYIGEAADLNLADPKTDIEVYVAGISTMFLAVIVSRRFSAKRPVFQDFLREQDMQAASVGCMVTGFLASSAIAILGSAAVQLERSFAQLNQLVSLGIIIGVMHEIRSSGGRRSMNLILALAIGYQFYVGGVISFSKQGMILPFFCWFLPVCALRYRLSWVQMGICLLGVFLLFHYLYPYAQYGRSFVNEQTTAEQRDAIALNLISHPERTRQLADASEADQPRGLNSYYNTPQGFWDRLQFISADDALVSFTDQGHIFGLYPIEAAILNVVPRFIWPNKPIVNFGIVYVHEMAGEALYDDIYLGISFSPTGEAYHLAKWLGILVIAPLVWVSLFTIYNSLFGDLRASPWGLLALVMISHVAPEGGVVGMFYMMSFGVAILGFCALFGSRVAPVIGSTLLGRKRRTSNPVSSGRSLRAFRT